MPVIRGVTVLGKKAIALSRRRGWRLLDGRRRDDRDGAGPVNDHRRLVELHLQVVVVNDGGH